MHKLHHVCPTGICPRTVILGPALEGTCRLHSGYPPDSSTSSHQPPPLRPCSTSNAFPPSTSSPPPSSTLHPPAKRCTVQHIVDAQISSRCCSRETCRPRMRRPIPRLSYPVSVEGCKHLSVSRSLPTAHRGLRGTKCRWSWNLPIHTPLSGVPLSGELPLSGARHRRRNCCFPYKL